MKKIFCILAVVVFAYGCGEDAPTPPKPKPPVEDVPDEPPAEKEVFSIYLGNSHSHCYYSGDVSDKSENNSPENHYALAAANGYDFYAITDHSQYEEYTQQAWEHVKRAADEATTASFVAMRGYEHSENNGPGAKGHMNVFNSSTYLNALAEGIDMTYFQKWLTERANSKTAVSMNHPGADQYDNFACYDEGAREVIAMFETINTTSDHYASYVTALSKGWKVSPVAGCDNHGWQGIAKWVPRTGIAAKSLTYESLLEAIRARRTYSTWDTNLRVMYYVNNFPMGSVFAPAEGGIMFSVSASDPDTGRDADKIVKIEIIGENDKVIESKTFSSHTVQWDVSVGQGQKYYYLKIYNASRSDAVAIAAPVWIKSTGK